LELTGQEMLDTGIQYVSTSKSGTKSVDASYYAMVCDRFGVKLNLMAGRKEAQVDEMLAALVNRAPWAVVGYSKELETAWNKDRSEFIESVLRRMAGGAPG